MNDDRNVNSDQPMRSATKECKFCHESIHQQARLCKACGQPQGMLRRSGRFVSAMLTPIVALGSLGIAYAQYLDATNARTAERHARAAEQSQVQASNAAVEEIMASLDNASRAALTRKLARTTKSQSQLERELQAKPTDPMVRKDLLLRKIIRP
jgi:hypothetical protein